MITKSAAEERGRTRTSWLDSRHSFSFGAHHDPRHMGFHALRVINEDVVAPGRGFGEHAHRDAEIFSYVLAGSLRHRDSLGRGGIVAAGDAQLMSAGRGITHSEMNASASEPVHFLQIWLLPSAVGGEPRHAELSLRDSAGEAKRLILSADGRAHSLAIGADADVWLCRPGSAAALTHVLAPGRGAWLQVVRGEITLNGVALASGDGAAAVDEAELRIESREAAEALLFDLA